MQLRETREIDMAAGTHLHKPTHPSVDYPQKPGGCYARRTGRQGRFQATATLEGLRISHERICQIICADETEGLRKHCRHKLKYRRHEGCKRKPSGRAIIPDRVSIHQRLPEAVPADKTDLVFTVLKINAFRNAPFRKKYIWQILLKKRGVVKSQFIYLT